MADSSPAKAPVNEAGAGAGASASAALPRKANPAFRMLGMPNIRPKLPSRNWTIFFSVVGTFAALVQYDRREKKKIQQRWCTVVANLADEPLDVRAMPRKVTVFLAAPPGDGPRPARDHFNEYIKPILVAGALDWDVVEGRREGEVRAGLAERIRKRRRHAGEANSKPDGDPGSNSVENVVEGIRQQTGVREWLGTKGDIVVGRHTWKEYVQGLHEGWLGPLQPPSPPVLGPETPSVTSADHASSEASTTTTESTITTTTESNNPNPKPPAPTTTKPDVPPPYISSETYSTIDLPPSMPDPLDPTSIIPFPHVLGFLKTPIRIYRFLTQRHLADEIGRETTAAVLGTYYRSFHSSTSATDPSSDSAHDGDDVPNSDSPFPEIKNALATEEKDWPRKIRERKDDAEGGAGDNTLQTPHAPRLRSRIWTEDVMLDPRVGQRMRRFFVDPKDDIHEPNDAIGGS